MIGEIKVTSILIRQGIIIIQNLNFHSHVQYCARKLSKQLPEALKKNKILIFTTNEIKKVFS